VLVPKYDGHRRQHESFYRDPLQPRAKSVKGTTSMDGMQSMSAEIALVKDFPPISFVSVGQFDCMLDLWKANVEKAQGSVYLYSQR
jgi:hypothetical protein